MLTLAFYMLTLVCAKVSKSIVFANFSTPNKLSLYLASLNARHVALRPRKKESHILAASKLAHFSSPQVILENEKS